MTMCVCGCGLLNHRKPSFSYGPEMICNGENSHICRMAHRFQDVDENDRDD